MIAGDSIDKHITILGILYIALSSIFLFAAVLFFVLIAGSGVISGDSDVIAVTGILGTVIAIFFIVLALPGILAGYGLLRHYPWARTLGIILAILNLVNLPLGTILGVYALWVLFHGESQQILSPARTRQ